MRNLWSRVAVVAVGLPLVLAAVWAGGWWLFALVTAAGTLALHEYFGMTRPLRPLALAGYAGLVGILVAIQMSGLVWAVGALLGTLALAFLLKGLGETLGSATASARIWPDCTFCKSVCTLLKPICTSPPISARLAGPVPL